MLPVASRFGVLNGVHDTATIFLHDSILRRVRDKEQSVVAAKALDLRRRLDGFNPMNSGGIEFELKDQRSVSLLKSHHEPTAYIRERRHRMGTMKS